MTSVSQNTSLSLSARLLSFIGPPTVILLTYLVSPRTALLSPLAFIPSALGYAAWRTANKKHPASRAKLEPLIWTFAGVGTIGMTGVILGQLAILMAISRLLFPDAEVRKTFMTEFSRATIDGLTSEELATRAALASTWRNWVFNTTLSFAMAGLLEELLKFSPIPIHSRKKSKAGTEDNALGNHAYLDLAIAAGLSFSLIEGIGFLHAACEGSRESGWILVRTIVERFGAGTTVHLLYAALTGLRATRKIMYGDALSWIGVVTPSILFHGTANTVAFACSAMEGNVGWIHPQGFWNLTVLYSALLGINGLAAWMVRREWREVRQREVDDQEYDG